MPPPPDRRLVWIVDDSPTDAARARAALESVWSVRTFPDGAAAIEALEAEEGPDVLVIDWLMPGISGIEVCRYIRSCRRDDPLGIILLTAYGSTEQVVEVLEAGANDYVSKPFIDEELRARVGNQVRVRELLERAEAAELRTREVLENAPDALIEIDAEGIISYANREATRVFGQPVGALKGAAIHGLAPGLEDLHGGAADGIRVAVPDIRLGERIYSPSVRVDLAGAPCRTIALREVTEERRAEARRLDFYSMVAHDLRSPLLAIQLRTDVILRGRRGLLPAELIADMHRIQANIRSLVAMITDFLDLSRLEVPGFGIRNEPVDLRELVVASVEDFRPLAEASRLTLETQAPGPLRLQGDPSRLRQVLSNLIGNALKFTPPGGRVVVRLEQRGGRAFCAVEDTGMGIARDALERIFERYTRALDASHEVAGSGLGLMIVREILHAHGGRVGVESELGRGSTFWFELPVAAGGNGPPSA